jgi:predicted ATPase
MKIKSISISGLFSFRGPAGQSIDLSDDSVNVIIGKNNSGKSNLGRALDLFIKKSRNIEPHDFHYNGVTSSDRGTVKISINLTNDFWDEVSEIITPYNGKEMDMQNARTALREIEMEYLVVRPRDSGKPAEITVNFSKKINDLFPVTLNFYSEKDEISVGRERAAKTIKSHIEEKLKGKFKWISFNRVYKLIGSGDDKLNWNLALLAFPPDHAPEDRRKFLAVQDLFRKISGLTECELLPNASMQNIKIQCKDHMVLPLDKFGDGIKQMLLLSYELVMASNAIVFIDEPESNLHVGAQRYIMKYLIGQKRDCQIIISTHSTIVLDSAPHYKIFQMDYISGFSEVKPLNSFIENRNVLDELGVRPSDILFSNVVIWVEGPSDRIYIKHCLGILEPGIGEGLSYTFAFYGGTNLSWHTVDEQAGRPNLLNVLFLCKNFIFLCDSDKRGETDKLKPRVLRIDAEISNLKRGLCMITPGREIENLIPESAVEKWALNKYAKELKFGIGKFDSFEDKINEGLITIPDTISYERNKTNWMAKFVENLNKEDLLKREDVVAFIQQMADYIKSFNAI